MNGFHSLVLISKMYTFAKNLRWYLIKPFIGFINSLFISIPIPDGSSYYLNKTDGL